MSAYAERYETGIIVELRYFDRMLSSEEIAALAAARPET